MWLNIEELNLLDSIFESEDRIPKNKKKGYKLRHISFFMSNTKAITNVCKNLEKQAMHIKLQHQYVEVLRKMGLINRKEKLTKYGEMLLKIVYYDNNRIIDEMKDKTSIQGLSDDIPFIVEFFLFAVVKKCIDNPDKCCECGIEVHDLAVEVIDNIKYFFSNVIDTLKEPTNKNSNLNELFSFENDEFYYVIQGMNFSGYEIKRLITLEKNEIDMAWKLYSRILDTVKNVDEAALSVREKKYYHYAKYYNNLVQKDVRYRVMHSIYNYILLDSIQVQRNKIRIVRKPEYDSIISYNFIEEMFEKYKLKEVYNLVYFEKDSKYITKEIKSMRLKDQMIDNIDSDNNFTVNELLIKEQHINIGDEIIFTDENLSKILKLYVYKILSIIKNDNFIQVNIDRREKINSFKQDEILAKFRGN